MPQFKVLERSHIGGRIVQPGEVIEYDGVASANLQPLDDEGAKRVKRPRTHAAPTDAKVVEAAKAALAKAGELEATIATLTEQLATAQAELVTANETIAAKDAEIATLTEQLAEATKPAKK